MARQWEMLDGSIPREVGDVGASNKKVEFVPGLDVEAMPRVSLEDEGSPPKTTCTATLLTL